MVNTLFWTVLRSVAIPVVAVYLLSDTPLGEKGALIAVGLALLITNFISILWNLLKILGNSVLLRTSAVLRLTLVVMIQVISVILIWVYYFSEYTETFN